MSYQLDSSISPNKTYVNMFIEGEEPEYVEDEERTNHKQPESLL